ncbi:TylF/MycF/NovP-related O-methyltransferase [Spirillospora sp. NPDC048911]|uniref:TylF/MycF/NovP-related O-methyltransferase n=1 Tax=Spirillospora sp. NPDC048911 TaxID=3364527 RepID=UPI003717EA00
MSKHPRDLYIDLLKRVLINLIYEDDQDLRFPLAEMSQFDMTKRLSGTDWPTRAHTMIGMTRLENLQHCVESVLLDEVPGDFIETGVWRGGACIFMRGVLAAHQAHDRRVWVADSFQGIPPTAEVSNSLDRWMGLDSFNDVLGVAEETVRANFARYELLDEQVAFLPGWFRDSLPDAPIEKLAIMRLDGDLYDSTMDALNHLYHKLSVGGYVIIDDYSIGSCRKAVTDFRKRNSIEDTIVRIDPESVYWRRSA